ncbi:MAG: regulatory protein RecX [Prevotella sp.]
MNSPSHHDADIERLAPILKSLTLLCSQGEHSSKDITEKLHRKGLSDADIELILAYLTEERYIDESRYCRAFIHDKMEYNHWGPRKIEQGLVMKGIARDIYQPLLADIDDDRWTAILAPLLAQKRRSVTGRNEYEIQQKLLRFAAGRGFTASQALRCLGDMDMPDID